MPGRTAVLTLVLGLFALVGSGCGDDGGDVVLRWQTEDGTPLNVSIQKLSANHDTVIYVDNDSGGTIKDAVLRFTPSDVGSAPIGFSVGTTSIVRTDFDGPTQVWRLGDIAPNTRVVFSLGLWFSASSTLSSAAPIDFVVELAGDNLAAAIPSNALTVSFQP